MTINTASNSALPLTIVKINEQDISNYLASGSTVEWYDVSKNSGRDTTNANGDMVLNVINDKYKLSLKTRPLTDTELRDFFSQIKLAPTMSVTFYNPYTGEDKTIQAYRGDRSITMLQPYGGELLFNAVDQALIEL